MSHNDCLANHPDLIAICMACSRDDCTGECIKYRNKHRELLGLPQLEETDEKPRRAKQEKRTGPKRGRIKIAAFGKEMTLKEWAAETGMGYHTLHTRLSSGMSPEEALTREVRSGPKHLLTYKGESHTIREWAQLLGCARSTLQTEIGKIEREGACCDGGNH